MSLVSLKKVIWAIDAFEPDREIYTNSARVLQQLVEVTGCAIQPVYILSESDLVYERGDAFELEPSYQSAAKNALKELLSTFEVKGMKEPTILVHRAYRSDGAA